MAEIERKEVVLSSDIDKDIKSVFEYGESLFGYSAAKTFITQLYAQIWELDNQYLINPENRFLTTKNKIYRNIIIGKYLVIYRITTTRIEVLSVISSLGSIRKIKSVRSTRIL